MTEEEEQVSFKDDSGDIPEIKKFEDFPISINLLRGILSYGWEVPSLIQSKSIVPVVQGRDCIIQAQSGSGKTGAFSIPAIGKVDETIASPQILILSPVHDLALQSFNIINSLCTYTDIKTTILIGKGLNKTNMGGYQKREDIPPPNFKAQIVVGTPGKVWDCLRKKQLSTVSMKMFILDEADEMLDKGFQEQIQTIFSFMPSDIQVNLFSATMPRDILQLSSEFMRNPTRILVKDEDITLKGIRQFYVPVESEQQKFDVLCDIYGTISVTQGIIFVNSKQKSEQLKEMLEQRNYTVGLIHGGYNQYERNDILGKFKEGRNRILIATDILCRGIDIQQINLVINYDIPFKVEKYIHRIGRSGRYGRKGVGINLVTPDDLHNLRKIEKFYSTVVERLPGNFPDLLK